jgi:type IV pilus assembly protein PilE
MKTKRGFTLLELMIVVGIVAILAAVALTAYNKQIRKSRRAEAKQVISDYALREEAYRATHATYTTTISTLLNGGTASSLIYYTVALSTPGGNCNDAGPTAAAVGNSFAVTATATGDQARDTTCTPLVITSLCGQVVKSPDPATTTCW